MNYIVLDLEWNQSTVGKNKELKALPFEIIEIGAVKLDENFQMVDRFQTVIRPVVYPQLNHISQEVTGFTYKDLKNGKKFPSAFRAFLDWCGPEEYRFCTWGPLDLTELQRNMQYYHFPLFPAPVYFYDVQEIFSCIADDGTLRRSLEYAVDYYQISKQGDFHRALSDAYYTALVMQKIDSGYLKRNYTADTFQKPKSPADEIHITCDSHEKYISRCFSSKTSAMKDKEVISVRCYLCGRRLRRKIQWFSDNNKNYYSLALCPEHGYVSGKIRIKKAEPTNYFVQKELRIITESEALTLQEKKIEYQKKKRLKRRQNKGDSYVPD